MELIKSLDDLKKWRRSQKKIIGFVPTMGALHAGHASLLQVSKQNCDQTVLSIFVNPTQFGPGEDFNRYPRVLEQDLGIAAANQVDVVFNPDPLELYPPGFSTFIEECKISLPLCGFFRPGHFRGVTTIVLKLLNLVQPHHAYFGLKDAQQFFVLHKMVHDLNLDCSIEGVKTLREFDGLALSSRNIYLSEIERATAPLLYQTLQKISLRFQNDSHQVLNNLDFSAFSEFKTDAMKTLQQSGFQIQYLEALSLPTFEPIAATTKSDHATLLAAAVFLGKTRLIDNILIRPELLKCLNYIFH